MPNVVRYVPFFFFSLFTVNTKNSLFFFFSLDVLVSVMIISVPSAVLGRFYPAAQVKPTL